MNDILFSSNKDDWETPEDLFAELHKEFWFDLDVAANAANHKCQVYFTKENSAFDNEWFGNVWCNPPYGREIGKWVEACFNYIGLSVMLLPARTDTKWFHRYIYNNPRCEIRFIEGRIHFINSKNAAPFPSMVVIFQKINNKNSSRYNLNNPYQRKNCKMKLTKEQKNQIYNENMCVDDWEWVPCINHVLRVLNYDDILEHDENYEKVKWSGTELQIKDNK